jgi:hypothetical protein
MAYDDDGGSIFGRDWAELEGILQQLISRPENVSFAQLSAALGVISQLGSETSGRLSIHEVDDALRRNRLGHLSVSVVRGLVDAAAKYPGEAASRITVRELEQILRGRGS